MRLGGTVASRVELALQILLRDLHIAHGHADITVSEQLHESGKTNTEAEHLRSEAVPQAVWRDRAGTACPVSSLGECREERLVNNITAAEAGDNPGPAVSP